MTKDTREQFFERYERFFMQSLDGKIDGGEMAELYAPEFIAASPAGVLAERMTMISGRSCPPAMSSTARWGQKGCTSGE